MLHSYSIEELSQIGIYRITAPSGKCYVGMTSDSFASRLYCHVKDLRNGNHKCRGLKRAFAKYGENKLQFEIIESFSPSSEAAKNQLFELEIKWWDYYSSLAHLYNGRPSGNGSVNHTDESKAKIAESARRARGNESGENLKLKYECTVCRGVTWDPLLLCRTCARLAREETFDNTYKDLFFSIYTTDISARECARQLNVPWKTLYRATQRWGISLSR